MFLLKRNRRQLLGLDITTSSVKLIELAESGGQYRVEAYAAEPTPQNAINEKAVVDAEAVGEAIRRAVKRAGAKSGEVAVAISGDAAITKVIQMPRTLRASDLESQVELQADQYIPFPMDEVSYDFEVLGPSEKDPETNDVLLVATRTENVEQRQAAVKAAGLTARIVDVEAFALENACKLMTHQMPDGGIDRTIAVVDFGASSTTFSVLRNLKVVYTRDFAFGGQQLTEEIMRTYGLSMEEAGRAKKEGGLPGNYQSEVLDPFIDDMTQHHFQPRGYLGREGRSPRADETLLARQGAGRATRCYGTANRVWTRPAELRLTCRALIYFPGAMRNAKSGSLRSSWRSWAQPSPRWSLHLPRTC
jgi:type IV pilus assembly protein PilM